MKKNPMKSLVMLACNVGEYREDYYIESQIAMQFEIATLYKGYYLSIIRNTQDLIRKEIKQIMPRLS